MAEHTKCPAVWEADSTRSRPLLTCEYPPHDTSDHHHFDGTYEVIWSTVNGYPEFVGPDPFRRAETSE